jgi:hypothetical protein
MILVVHCASVGGSRLKSDDGDIIYKNILMFENVVKAFSGKILFFSSGAALRGNPPTLIHMAFQNGLSIVELRCYQMHTLSEYGVAMVRVNYLHALAPCVRKRDTLS